MNLRIPSDLHAELKRIAEEEDRSMHSLIVHTLRRMVAERATDRRPDSR